MVDIIHCYIFWVVSLKNPGNHYPGRFPLKETFRKFPVHQAGPKRLPLTRLSRLKVKSHQNNFTKRWPTCDHTWRWWRDGVGRCVGFVLLNLGEPQKKGGQSKRCLGKMWGWCLTNFGGMGILKIVATWKWRSFSLFKDRNSMVPCVFF